MPGAREAIEQKSWKEAEAQLAIIAAAVQREAALVHKAADVLQKKQRIE